MYSDHNVIKIHSCFFNFFNKYFLFGHMPRATTVSHNLTYFVLFNKVRVLKMHSVHLASFS